MQAMGGASGLDARTSGEKAPKKRRNRPSASDDAGIIRDRVSKQCFDLQEAYGLSLRETEVMELIARGNS
ncbi:MAG: LuxR family transcriptional regulator, partial [Gordonibacter sp.]